MPSPKKFVSDRIEISVQITWQICLRVDGFFVTNLYGKARNAEHIYHENEPKRKFYLCNSFPGLHMGLVWNTFCISEMCFITIMRLEIFHDVTTSFSAYVKYTFRWPQHFTDDWFGVRPTHIAWHYHHYHRHTMCWWCVSVCVLFSFVRADAL